MAVKTYSLKQDGDKYCSEHTRVREMRSKDGTDKILIDEKLMAMIEKLFTALKCTKYIITSGYRTTAHDKAVGGNGKGQHTKGTAVDCYFYGANGRIISSKEVSCIAQDLGFKGIANITDKYQAIHLDMRTLGKYYGNEVYGTNNVTSDFYAYYGIDRYALRKKYGLPVDEKISITYQVWDDKQDKWLPNVTDNKSYAGKFGNAICCVMANLSKGNVTYRVHTKGGKWLSAVKNRGDYAGVLNKPIDAVMFKTDTGLTIHYQVHIKGGGWLPYVTGYDEKDGNNGYAGVLGKEIDGIRVYLK